MVSGRFQRSFLRNREQIFFVAAARIRVAALGSRVPITIHISLAFFLVVNFPHRGSLWICWKRGQTRCLCSEGENTRGDCNYRGRVEECWGVGVWEVSEWNMAEVAPSNGISPAVTTPPPPLSLRRSLSLPLPGRLRRVPAVAVVISCGTRRYCLLSSWKTKGRAGRNWPEIRQRLLLYIHLHEHKVAVTWSVPQYPFTSCSKVTGGDDAAFMMPLCWSLHEISPFLVMFYYRKI